MSPTTYETVTFSCQFKVIMFMEIFDSQKKIKYHNVIIMNQTMISIYLQLKRVEM